jgi:hypothetical protein
MMKTCVYELIFGLLLILSGCSGVPPVSTSSTDGTLAASPTFSWMLPKTVLQVEAKYTLTDCRVEKGKLRAIVNITTAVTPSYIADPSPGPLARDGWIILDTDKLHTFWQDHQIEVKTYQGTHVLQQLSTTATDQTGQIVSNVITSVTKLAGIAFGVPTASGQSEVQDCTPGKQRIGDVESKTKDLAKVDPNGAQGKRLTQQIQSLKNSLSFSVTCFVDPGYFANACGDLIKNDGQAPQIIHQNRVATIRPDGKQLRQSGWYKNEISDNADTSDFALEVYLDFANGRPKDIAPCVDDATPCSRRRVELTSGAFYREPAYIPVRIYQGSDSDAEHLLFLKSFFFGQFGVPRSVPTHAPTFGKAAWTLNFGESGELTDGSYGSVAIGVGATSLLQGASTGASSFDASRIKGSQLLDSTTQSQQLENTRLQTIIQGATYRQQCQQLLSQGQVQSCD